MIEHPESLYAEILEYYKWTNQQDLYSLYNKLRTSVVSQKTTNTGFSFTTNSSQ